MCGGPAVRRRGAESAVDSPPPWIGPPIGRLAQTIAKILTEHTRHACMFAYY